ncbi:METTL5 family protein [Natrialbaceae archaeon A-arb3/5]
MTTPSRRALARDLEAVADFADPSVELEQYRTPAEVAAHVCHFAGLQGDFDRPVVDLGTGTGMLALASVLAGAARVVGIDVDRDALATARENTARVESSDRSTDRIDWLRGDVTRHPFSLTDATVVSNPPFGAQRGSRHADREFLEVAREIGRVSYTIHNEGSQEFVESFAADEGGEVTHAFRATFPIDRRFEFHTQESAELAAEVFRIEWDR